MIRKLLQNRERHEADSKRNYEVQRIETFSDGVFAFAVTLLIVSLEVPKNFAELMINMRGFFAFGISFILLVFIWMEQHRFFRNYGLEDHWTIVLNVALLFLVLFYVYPLKFLFTLVFRNEIYGSAKAPLEISDQQGPILMQIYSLGYIAIYFLFTLMYTHAYKKADFLGLTTLERFDCKTDIYKQVILGSVGLASLICTFILPLNHLDISGYIYVLIGPALTIFFYSRKKIRNKKFTAE
ncbi:MAG TPA: TMEM175 family protein [Puia sp.]|jgi:uncharacterized membrane protein|nr:TMEM175 family protein [Puia sp.]